MRAYLAACGLLVGACAGDDTYVIVTIEARPAVQGARKLTVALSNAGSTRMDSLTLDGQDFPVTFSISAPDRSGELAIAVDATDDRDLVVGRGTVTTTVDAPTARLLIDPADFVVNTEFADNQFPADDFESVGFQLAALPDGKWTAAFRDACPSRSCNVFARRFDKLGAPVQTVVSASSNAFNLNTKPTTSLATPAIAAGATTTLAVWDAYDVGTTPTVSTVACRALDAAGNATAAQTAVATEAADVVSLAALANGSFLASWNVLVGGNEVIHAAIIKPDCTPLAATPLTVSTIAGFTHRSAVAGSGERALVTWILVGDLHARVLTNTGAFVTVDTVLVPKTATEQIMHARVAPASGGFLIAVRWAQIAATGPGRIELIRVDANGVRVGEPILVTDRSASDADTGLDNREALGLASRPDGSVMVAWHTCGALGDGSLCGVFGRILRDTGEPITETFGLATTTEGDQKRPSVVGLPDAFVVTWTDASARPPDTAGQSVRARIIYPPGP